MIRSIHARNHIAAIRSLMSTIPVRSTAASGSQVYESDRAVHEYLQMHFGNIQDQMPYDFGPKEALSFCERSAQVCIDHYDPTKQRSSRALDIGCAVGGVSFHLSKNFDEVVGIDFSQHFVDAANQMKANGSMNFDMMSHGNVFEPRIAQVPPGSAPHKINFMTGDACNLPSHIGKFDVILACNLLCRLPNPRKFIKDVPQFLAPGGILVLISPYSWLTEYTSESEWFGGRRDANGHAINSFDEVRGHLAIHAPDLKMELKKDFPFLIREHERKFQYGVSDCTVWRKQ